jgi:hypothetical protein
MQKGFWFKTGPKASYPIDEPALIFKVDGFGFIQRRCRLQETPLGGSKGSYGFAAMVHPIANV